MNWQATAAAIRSRFATLIETPQSLEVVYDNEPDRDAHAATWCRLTIAPGERFYAEMPGRSRTPGIAFAQLFCTVGAGTDTVHTLADTIAASFERTTVGGVRYLTPGVSRIGQRPGSKWYQVNVEIRFLYDDT